MKEYGWAFSLSMGVCALSYPLWMRINTMAGFNDVPNYRSSHQHVVPKIGGLLLLTAVSSTVLLLSDLQTVDIYLAISFLVLVMSGVIDDLLQVPPVIKLLFQVVAAWFFSFYVRYDWLLNSPFPGWGQAFAFALMVVMLNAQNLIDGIDGLSASIGLFQAVALFFLLSGNPLLRLSLAGMAGALLVFLFFNFSRSGQKGVFRRAGR
ncbi:MAG: undecaprenyl/decaprenyl-phosphate alpha-N-acetylglucosaminyl 1-phosphate transferase [Cytophagales bacterium]|nr:undecaprenyl/decaprenyl-phosphate alpha-N-acetylglucosaminyl 1-phosphate transferase [Cytophagales bacterium]